MPGVVVLQGGEVFGIMVRTRHGAMLLYESTLINKAMQELERWTPEYA
jgi:hypothetical protein